MLIYSYSKPSRTEVLLLETKVVLKYKEGVWLGCFKKKYISIMLYVLFRTDCSLTMEMVTVIVLLSKNEPLQELTHEGLQNTWGQQQGKLMLL